MLKIKDGYLLREVAGNSVAIPIGNATVDFNGMITLSETGAFLWKKLAEGATEETLLENLLAEYEIDQATAKKDIAAFLKKMQDAKLITEYE